MKCCRVCGQERVRALIDFGALPVSHHFYDGVREEYRHPLVLGQCGACAQIQLLDPCPPEQLAPRYDWLVHNEPEAHLDELVARLPAAKQVTGVSPKDESLLRRLGGTRLPLCGGVERIQQQLTPAVAAGLGRFDLVIARHILEHAHEPIRFLRALRALVEPDGYVVIEVPDTAGPFARLDYTVMWEEHVLYFSAATLRQCLQRAGFRVSGLYHFPAPYETPVVAIATPGQESGPVPCEDITPFVAGYRSRCAAWRAKLQRAGQVALFGAGHHASVFTHLMGVADRIAFVVDDNPHKQALRMPGTRLPIVGTATLLASEVALCLSSLGWGSEQKVRAKLRDFRGRFESIFPTP